MKYSLSAIARICDGEFVGIDLEVRSVFVDSRSFNIDRGSLFFAISGTNHDGHSYIGDLYRRGVRAFVLEREMNVSNYPEAGFVVVKKSVDALQALAADYRTTFKGVMVGVTGSNGKTVVKEWLSDLLPGGVKLFRSPKSYNSQVGVPLSVLMIRGDEQVAIIEAGISQPDEMERLERVICPDIGVITTIGDAHQEGFDSIDEKVNEKLKLFEKSRTIIYNREYSEVESALRRQYPDRELVDASGQWQAYNLFTDSASRQNAAMAVAICDVLGYDHRNTVSRLPVIQPIAMRLELKEGLNDSVVVNDSYNSDINSLTIALDYLFTISGGRRQTLILSDILQSGYSEQELYGKVAQLVKLSAVDKLVGIGERISRYGSLFDIETEFHHTTEGFLGNIRREDIAGRAILIKGNRESQFERISHALERKSHTTTLEVGLDAMINNLNVYRAMLKPTTKVMAMVKASSYGHGGYEVAATLQHQGVDYLAVAFADEGVVLRERGITMPIVVLNADSDSFELMIGNQLEPEIYNFHSLESFIKELKRYGERDYPIHIKLDTGMHRLGFSDSEIELLGNELLRGDGIIKVRSIFSHLAASDDSAQDDFTRQQILSFDTSSSILCRILGYNPTRHIANSAAVERIPETEYDMVRLGIGLYGGVSACKDIKLRQVSSLRTRIVQIKSLDNGETVGYGREGKIAALTSIATIPIGYADGVNRHLGHGRWEMIVNGQKAPTVGRIAMDTCMIDITGIDAKEGDEVIIYSDLDGNRISDMARVLDTIAYEVMTSISARVKRVYMKD